MAFRKMLWPSQRKWCKRPRWSLPLDCRWKSNRLRCGDQRPDGHKNTSENDSSWREAETLQYMEDHATESKTSSHKPIHLDQWHPKQHPPMHHHLRAKGMLEVRKVDLHKPAPLWAMPKVLLLNANVHWLLPVLPAPPVIEGLEGPRIQRSHHFVGAKVDCFGQLLQKLVHPRCDIGFGPTTWIGVAHCEGSLHKSQLRCLPSPRIACEKTVQKNFRNTVKCHCPRAINERMGYWDSKWSQT